MRLAWSDYGKDTEPFISCFHVLTSNTSFQYLCHGRFQRVRLSKSCCGCYVTEGSDLAETVEVAKQYHSLLVTIIWSGMIYDGLYGLWMAWMWGEILFMGTSILALFTFYSSYETPLKLTLKVLSSLNRIFPFSSGKFILCWDSNRAPIKRFDFKILVNFRKI